MAGWHHRLNGHEFEQAPGIGDGLGGLACCSPWDRKESAGLSNRTELRNEVTIGQDYITLEECPGRSVQVRTRGECLIRDVMGVGGA